MMNLKKLCSTFILVLTLATSALAGEMECPITSPTPPAATATQDSSAETPGVASTMAGVETSAADVSVAEAALGLVGTVLMLF